MLLFGKELKYHSKLINSLPNSKILEWSKLKELAGDIKNVVHRMKVVTEHSENIVGEKKLRKC